MVKKKNIGAVWECSKCGKIEYGKLPPEECGKCEKANSFVEVPEDMAEEMEGHLLEEIKPTGEGDEEFDEEDF